MHNIYLVMESDGYESTVVGVFLDESKAEIYKNQSELLNPDWNFFVLEQKLMDDDPDLDKTVVNYYQYYFSKDPEDKITKHDLFEFLDMDVEDFNNLTEEQVEQKIIECNHPDIRWCNSESDLTPKLDEGDLIIEDTDDHVCVYAKNSYEEARSKALELWSEYENQCNKSC